MQWHVIGEDTQETILEELEGQTEVNAEQGAGWYPGKRIIEGLPGLLGGLKDKLSAIEFPGIEGTGFEYPIGRQKNWKQIEGEWVNAPKSRGQFNIPNEIVNMVSNQLETSRENKRRTLEAILARSKGRQAGQHGNYR